MVFDKRLLVTGAGGQLGRALARLAPEATFLDRAALDVTDRAAVSREIGRWQPEVIIHCAAYTRVDAAEADPEGAFVVNVQGTQAVADAAETNQASLVYLSTDYVFPGDGRRPIREEDAIGPRSVYGLTKLEGEKIAEKVDLHLIVRTSWVFGDGNNFVRAIINAARTRDELEVVDDQYGLPTYALDLARGVLELLERGAAGFFHLCGGGEPATWADLAEFVLQDSGSSAKVRRVSTAQYYATRQGKVAPRPANSVLDCSKAAAIGVRLRPWPQAVSEYLEEMK